VYWLGSTRYFLEKSRDDVSKEKKSSHNHQTCSGKFNQELKNWGNDNEPEHEEYKTDSGT
tara:strand:+ start:3370 stop:3549 length:180 start_codon:yes stop_codon:yes gene_type:complete